MIKNTFIVSFLSLVLISCTAHRIEPPITQQRNESESKPVPEPNAEVSSDWWDFSYLELGHPDEDEYLVIKKDNYELSAEIFMPETGSKEMKAVLIQGAGYFYQGDRAKVCVPDYFEAVGIAAKFYLYILSAAFPDGPEKITEPTSVTVSNGKSGLVRFWTASAPIPDGWNAEITIIPENTSEYSITVQTDIGRGFTSPLKWARTDVEVVSSDESLARWLPCWIGNFAQEASSLKTFGEIRRAVKKNN